jgi:hypothetical protein
MEKSPQIPIIPFLATAAGLIDVERAPLVLAERVGNAFVYRLNTEHLAAEPIKALARLGSTFMTRLEHHLEAWEQPPVYAADSDPQLEAK